MVLNVKHNVVDQGILLQKSMKPVFAIFVLRAERSKFLLSLKPGKMTLVVI